MVSVRHSIAHPPDKRTDAALEFLRSINNDAVAVSKPVRAGLTTSTIIAANIENKKLLVIAPTMRILRETVHAAAQGGAVMVSGNAACPLLDEELEEHPVLKEIPISLPENCEKCKLFGTCEVTAIINQSFKAAGISYQKIQALMLSKTSVSEKIKSTLQEVEVVLLDEAHIIGFGATATTSVGRLVPIDEKYKTLNNTITRWNEFREMHENVIIELTTEGQSTPASKHLSRHVLVEQYYDWEELRAVWGELRVLAKSKTESRETILTLRDIIDIMSQPWAVIHWVTDAGTCISGSRARGDRTITDFLHNVVYYAAHIYASGTLIEPHADYFKELSGKPVKRMVFPDVMNASSKMTLIPDKWSINATSFSKKLPAIVDMIRKIKGHENAPIYCLCQSAKKAAVLRKELNDKTITVDYYRSDMSIGVARPERVVICVGMAEIPANAYDPMAHGAVGDERWIDSRKLRLQAVHAATWQGLNRVRDPDGKTPSRAYLLGVRLNDVRHLATWGPNREVILVDIRNTTFLDGTPTRSPVFQISVDERVEHCKVSGADVASLLTGKKSVVSLIDRVELYGGNIINLNLSRILPTIYNRENSGFLEFYNISHNSTEIATNAVSLYQTFICRDDTYGKQSKDGSYARIKGYVRHDELKDHVSGKITVGGYNSCQDDTVIWGCFDIDSHDNSDGSVARNKATQLISTMKKYSIPYMLEASGTPGSYHIWVLLKRTATHNAFLFMREIAKEAKIKDIEIFPKQKRVKNYGNLVKLPLGINQKNNRRSMFLNDDFEPIEGKISVPGIVVLENVPIQETDPIKKTDEKLNYCMEQVLAAGEDMSNGGGHMLRLAIATKAANIGMSPAEAAILFKGQSDFDYDISLRKCREPAEYGYKNWSCAKLRECGTIVTRWCETCASKQS